MAKHISRRDLLGTGLVAGAASVLTNPAMAQDQTQPPTDTTAVEARLQASFPAEHMARLQAAVKESRTRSEQRLKHPLTENSEPCFSFKAIGADKR